MSPGSSTESYPGFAQIGLRENPRKTSTSFQKQNLKTNQLVRVKEAAEEDNLRANVVIDRFASQKMSRYREWDLSCKVYVGNLGSSASKHEIESAFSKYGPLRNVWVARNPPGFAFVEFEDPRDAEDAVRGLDGTKVYGRILHDIEDLKTAIREEIADVTPETLWRVMAGVQGRLQQCIDANGGHLKDIIFKT
ncbi:hypothetical protein ANN_20485 [Periplaneta americana]|uniref:RRM domain-containing protein n=1 Tax=Periplaneta americana TaxID=6978 RepID=A0ABQ8SCU7_PERAM|nr:hypothetical protein ANN_20485 [Periplaneta americana]